MARPVHPEIAKLRAEIARAARQHSRNADPERVEAARRLLEANRRHRARIDDLLAEAGLITQSTMDGIAALLRPSGGDSK